MKSRFRGCLLAGAVGDALGNEIEFWRLDEIRSRCGPQGVTGYVGRAEITDDTQMTLFTAEGMIRALVRLGEKGITDFRTVVHHAYLRWLFTQGDEWSTIATDALPAADGWLVAEPGLHHRRAPGNTCLTALAIGRRRNARPSDQQFEGLRRSDAGCPRRVAGRQRRGRVLHGLRRGRAYPRAPQRLVAGRRPGRSNHLDSRRSERAGGRLRHPALVGSKAGARRNVGRARCRLGAGRYGRMPTPEDLETLGGGWVGEEALAIAVCCRGGGSRPSDRRSWPR